MSEHDVPTFREFADLDKRHTALEATVTNQLSRMSTDLTEIKMLVMRPPQVAPPADHINWQSTAMRAMDMLERKQSGGIHPVLLFLSGLGLLALGGAIAWVVLH